MSTRLPISKIHLKRNSYQHTTPVPPTLPLPSKSSTSSRLIKTDRCPDSNPPLHSHTRTSFKGLQDSKYQSVIMKRMLTESRQEQILRTPTSMCEEMDREEKSYGTPSATDRERNREFQQRRVGPISNFTKKKQSERISSNFYTQQHCHQYDNDYAIRKYEQTEAILCEKNKRVGDLQKLYKFFMKRAEELADIGQDFGKKNEQLKEKLKGFEGVAERVGRLQKRFEDMAKREEKNEEREKEEKREILMLTRMC